MQQSERYAAVEELANRLRGGEEHVTWTPASQEQDGSIARGYPNYPEWLIDGLNSATAYLEHSPGFDAERAHAMYSRLFDGQSSFPINGVTAEELWANLTFAIRGERFADGHIASLVENGIVLDLAEVFLLATPDPRRPRPR